MIATNGPIPPIPLDRPTPLTGGGVSSRSPGKVGPANEGLAVGGPTEPEGMGWGWRG